MKFFTFIILSLFTFSLEFLYLVSCKEKQHKYVKNKKYVTWVKLLFFKTIFGLIAAYGLELIAKIFVPEDYRKKVLKYMRIGSFLFLFVYSGIIREFRETQLKKKTVENAEKPKAQ